jgi:polysaccharide biosynthesis protein PslG
MIALLATAAAFLVLSMPAQARPPRDFVGITSEDVFARGGSYRAKNMRRQSRLRIGTIRQVFDWAQIERSPNRFSFARYDAFVLAAARYRIRVLPVLFNPPSFRSKAPSTGRLRGTYPPRSNAAMGAFAARVARRYGRNGTLWRGRGRKLPITAYQVWNEPPLPVYWRPRPSAAQYAALLRAVSAAIRGVDRRAEIVTAGLPPSKLRGAVPLTRYIRGLYAAGAGPSFNTLAVNSYAQTAGQLRRLLRGVRRTMNRRGGRRDRIRVTEIGWATQGPRHRFRVGRRGQARRITSSIRTLGRLRRRYRIRGFVYYSWRDSRPYPPEFKNMWGLHTGLLTRGGRRKPGYHAFRRAVRRLR